jgi:hypothetical protein
MERQALNSAGYAVNAVDAVVKMELDVSVVETFWLRLMKGKLTLNRWQWSK